MKRRRKGGRNVGWVGENVLTFRDFEKTTGEFLIPRSCFQKLLHLRGPGLPITAAELGRWLGAPLGVLEHEGKHSDESQGTADGPSISDAPAVRDWSGCNFMDVT